MYKTITICVLYHPDSYHADFTLDGVSTFGLTGSDPLSASARFLLTALRQNGMQTDLPAPDPMPGNPDEPAPRKRG